MNRPIIRKHVLTAGFAPLAATRTVGTFMIRTRGTAGTVTLLSDDGVTEVALDKASQYTLEGIDLAEIRAKGTAGDEVVIIGATRTL